MEHIYNEDDFTVTTSINELISQAKELHDNLAPIRSTPETFGAWSVSKIKTLQKCPLKFYLTYVAKLKHKPEPSTEERIRTNVGLASHLILERVVKGDTLKEAADLAKSKYPELANTNGWNTINSVLPNIEAFSTRIKTFSMNNPIKEIRTELRVGYTKDKKKTEFFAKDVYFRGVIDLVLMLKNEDAVIIDHKFGVDPSIYGIKNQKFQLDSYKSLVHFGYKNIKGATAGVHGIQCGEIVLEPRNTELKEIESYIPHHIDLQIEGGCLKIQEIGFFKHIREANHCKWCEFNEPCSQKLLKDLELDTKNKLLKD